jgi:hypothetical protein
MWRYAWFAAFVIGPVDVVAGSTPATTARDDDVDGHNGGSMSFIELHTDNGASAFGRAHIPPSIRVSRGGYAA